MKRVYIVDDSLEIRQRLIALLAETDNIVVVGHAATAEEALQDMERAVPDTLLLDIRLPGKSGIDLLSDVKGRYPRIQVIIMTNYDDPRYRWKSLQAGAQFFFNKTRDFEALIETLKAETPEALPP